MGARRDTPPSVRGLREEQGKQTVIGRISKLCQRWFVLYVAKLVVKDVMMYFIFTLISRVQFRRVLNLMFRLPK